MLILSIAGDIKFGVLDILRGIGIGIINIIFNTIDTLYNVAKTINSINFIRILEEIENSPFTKIFNAFFILSFVILLLFSIWKITFKIFDADSNDQPIYELVKEIAKCVVLIFCTYLIFNSTINIGIDLSNAIYNNFNDKTSTIGDKMKTAYLNINESCYKVSGGENIDSKNVQDLKKSLEKYSNVEGVETMEDFEELIRNNKLTATNITDSGSFSYRCTIYKQGIWNDSEDYAFSYNFLFGIIIGAIFLFSIGFAVLMLGKRQLELAFLMAISPIVFATSIGRKEQRSALYQQLASLVLQAGALMLLIGLTSVLFNAIQNSSVINNLSYFTKVVTQSILYLGCAMMLLTGSTTLNRFIGENVSANSGRDAMMAIKGVFGGMATAGAASVGAVKAAVNTPRGVVQAGRGIAQIAGGVKQTAKGAYNSLSKVVPNLGSNISSHLSKKVEKGNEYKTRGEELSQNSNPITRMYGKRLESKGQSMINDAQSQWNFETGTYSKDYMREGIEKAKIGGATVGIGISNISNAIRNIPNPNAIVYRKIPKIKSIAKESESI